METGQRSSISNLIITRNGSTGSAAGLGLRAFINSSVFNCVVHNIRGAGITSNSSTGTIEGCEVYNCNTSNAATSSIFLSGAIVLNRCIVLDCTGNGIWSIYSSGSISDCIVDTCTGAGITAAVNSNNLQINGCTVYGNGGIGISVTVAGNGGVVSVLNTGRGLTVAASLSFLVLVSVNSIGLFGNVAGNVLIDPSVAVINGSIIDLLQNPIANAASGNFTLTSNEAKNAGFGVFTQTQSGHTGTQSYPDLGAVQSASSGSSGFIGLGRLGT